MGNVGFQNPECVMLAAFPGSVAIPVFVPGQSFGGSISALVTDLTGAAVPEVIVTVIGTQGNVIVDTISNQQACYPMSSPATGNCSVSAETP